MAILTIGGVAMPTPTELGIGVMDISKAERNAKGYLILERVTTKQKLTISYSFITAEDLTTLLNAISPLSYSVTYLNPITNSFKTYQMYCGDRNVGMMDYVNGVARYKDFTFDLIER
jgi:hypothetical protein